MEIHQLRYFCAVAQHGTFTRASEAEHVAQPSLSQQILKLEAELGARLFDRLPRSARLTVFGQAFLPKAQRILRELGDAKTEMMEMAGDAKGNVVLGTIPTISTYLLPRILAGFSQLHEQVAVRVVEDLTAVLMERLHDGTVDMAVVALPVPGEEVACQALFEEPFYAVLPEKHELASRTEIRLAELHKQPFLLLKEGHCFRDSMISACRSARIRPNVVFESGQFATILAMVSAGMGVSAVPAMAVQQMPGCRYVRLADKRGMRKIGLIRLKHHFETRAQRFLWNHVMEVTQPSAGRVSRH
jgi:LysR family hydrogen peroxide-inducible transcriptional activator